MRIKTFNQWFEAREITKSSQLNFLGFGEEATVSPAIAGHFCKTRNCKLPAPGETIEVRPSSKWSGALTVSKTTDGKYVVKHHDPPCCYPDPSCPCGKCHSLSTIELINRDAKWRKFGMV